MGGVVASPVLRRAAPVAAALAAALAALLLLVLALRSPDRQQSLLEYQAAGTLRHVPTEQVLSVELMAGAHTQRFQRGDDGGWQAEGGGAAPAAVSAAMEAGLRLLHNTPPERDFEVESTEFGLSPPWLKVDLRTADGRAFEAEFGRANPIGMAHYARVTSEGQVAIVLMPSYVAQAWTPACHCAAP